MRNPKKSILTGSVDIYSIYNDQKTCIFSPLKPGPPARGRFRCKKNTFLEMGNQALQEPKKFFFLGTMSAGGICAMKMFVGFVVEYQIILIIFSCKTKTNFQKSSNKFTRGFLALGKDIQCDKQVLALVIFLRNFNFGVKNLIHTTNFLKFF